MSGAPCRDRRHIQDQGRFQGVQGRGEQAPILVEV